MMVDNVFSVLLRYWYKQEKVFHAWSYKLDGNISTLIMNFTNELFENGLVEKILKLLDGLSVEGELEKLHKGRAVGDDRHGAQPVERRRGAFLLSVFSIGPVRTLSPVSKQLCSCH